MTRFWNLSLLLTAAFAASPCAALGEEFPGAPDQIAVTGAAPSAPSAPPGSCSVAVSAHRKLLGHVSAPELIVYESAQASGGAWINDSVLIVPRGCAGRYLLSVSFIKDTHPNTCSGMPVGTGDDVFAVFYRRGPGETQRKLVGSSHGAWNGVGSARRNMASYTIVAPLNAGDEITTYSAAHGDRPRCLRNITFTAAVLN